MGGGSSGRAGLASELSLGGAAGALSAAAVGTRATAHTTMAPSSRAASHKRRGNTPSHYSVRFSTTMLAASPPPMQMATQP